MRFETYMATGGLCQSLGNCESQSCSLCKIIEFIEPLVDTRLIGFGDTDTGIGDIKANTAITTLIAKPDRTAWCIFNGVSQIVEHNLREPVFVQLYITVRMRVLTQEHHIRIGILVGGQYLELVKKIGEIESFRITILISGFDFREVQDVADNLQ